MMKDIVIFDLDGTLAHIRHRMHFIKSSPLPVGQEPFKADWDGFYEACHDDTPITEVIDIMLALHSVGYQIWITSGRSIAVKDKTLAWLERHAIIPDMLVMRPLENYIPTHELKETWLNDGTIPKDRVMCVFEDRPQVVGMWRRNGITVMEVADGGGIQ